MIIAVILTELCHFNCFYLCNDYCIVPVVQPISTYMSTIASCERIFPGYVLQPTS